LEIGRRIWDKIFAGFPMRLAPRDCRVVPGHGPQNPHQRYFHFNPPSFNEMNFLQPTLLVAFNKTSWRFDLLVITVTITAVFFGTTIIVQHFKITALKILAARPTPKTTGPNFLFTKVDPPSEPPPAMPEQTPAQNPSQSEAFLADTNNSDEPLAKMNAEMKAEQDAQQAQADWQQNLQEQAAWTNCFPYFHRALIELHDQLHDLSRVEGDGIVQPENYYDLPKSIDQKVGDFPLTHIGFQENTNIYFTVTVLGFDAVEKRKLLIVATDGRLQFNVNWANKLNGYLDEYNPAVPYHETVSLNAADALIRYEINALIKAQWKYSKALKSATNTIDGIK
jgi:hypothetical protein